jgi:diguanylate cyclase (GGDEF)-like protein
VIGRPGTELFYAWPELVELILDGQPAQLDFALQQAGSIRYFDLSLAPLSDRFNQPLGQLLILHDITERKKAEEELRSLSQTDPLTGLYNRRKFFEVMQREIIRARRYGQPLSLIMIDVDSLKSVNDRFGHSAGDEVLHQVADCIQPTRATDLAARVGGDEFALLLPETHSRGAEQVAWRLLEAVHRVQLDFDAAISMSMGIAQLEPGDEEQGESLLARADKAMYLAKRGRLGCAVSKELTQPVRR